MLKTTEITLGKNEVLTNSYRWFLNLFRITYSLGLIYFPLEENTQFIFIASI